MNYGYEYDVNVAPGGMIVREVTYVEPGVTGLPLRTLVMREVINSLDVLTRGALVELGWTPPMPPKPPPPPQPPHTCVVRGCTNRSDCGKFAGLICGSCYAMITSGKVGGGDTFIHQMRDRLIKIASIAA